MSGELGSYHIVVGNMGDRNDLELWWNEGSLIERVAAVCNNTVVVVHSVGPVQMRWSNHPNISAIIYAGAPGEQTGPALVDVLYGASNPRGRLPFTITDVSSTFGKMIFFQRLTFVTVSLRMKAITGHPSFILVQDFQMYCFFSFFGRRPIFLMLYTQINYSEKLSLDYRNMDKLGVVPRFEFGFGLSYTTFTYSSIAISPSGTAYRVSFTVANSGSLAGTEIPQLYLGFPPSAGEPKKVLRGFDEVLLGVGERKTVTMLLDQRSMR